MDVRYKRDMNRNYMILMQLPQADYQLKMMSTNHIKGLLPAHTSVFNGVEEIYYDISSRQPITRLYAKKELKQEDIRAILRSANDLLEEIKRFLLDGSNVLFSPEFCYCNPENGNTEWVFYPGNQKDCNFMELAEFFIERVDHTDSKAVDMAYRFFKKAKEDNFVLGAFMNEMIPEMTYEENEEDICTENYEAVVIKEPDVERKRPLTLVEKVQNYIKEKFEAKRILPEKNIHESVVSPQNDIWENYGLNESYNGETLVMGVANEPAQRRLTSIMRGSSECISLENLPCVLGKMSECSDVVLQDKSVSRMHAKIFEENGELYLQDLNSTNGSFLNGLQLETNEILKIKIGDEIGFGNLRYRYE